LNLNIEAQIIAVKLGEGMNDGQTETQLLRVQSYLEASKELDIPCLGQASRFEVFITEQIIVG
jgi:hypothetical protein